MKTLFLALVLFGAGTAGAQQPQTPRFERTLTRVVEGRYLVYLPKGYAGEGPRKWPLLLYLHGGSARGSDLNRVRALGLPRLLETGFEIPFIVVAPQCPAGEIWTDTDFLLGVLDDVQRRYAVDPARVYATGHSMGGRGTWYVAYKHPERFAAILPLAGLSPITDWATRLRTLPVWAFHGQRDTAVPLADSEAIVEALRTVKAPVTFTVLPDRDHFILDVYERPDVYARLLGHRKR